MIRPKFGGQPKTKPGVGLREDFVDYSLIQVKLEPVETINNDGTNDPLLIEASSINIKQEPSTEPAKREFYGRIALEKNDNGSHIYHFVCDKCTQSFSSVESFDEHITNNYLTTSKGPFPEESEYIIAADKIKVDIAKAKDEQPPPNTSLRNDESTEKEDAIDSDNENMQDFSESASEEKSSEPAAKKQKRSFVLSFDYPDQQCVTFFLELLKANAILWLKKQSVIKPFTAASNTFITAFKAKFPAYNMTKTNLQKAVDRMKSSYERANSQKNENESSDKIGTFEGKYSEFLKLCAEIDKNSKEIEKNCDLCKAVFYCAKELQTHKFKRHKVGELPYKCNRCGYGFAELKALASHEEKHDRVKSFECEICGYSCYLESKLLAHHANMHSEDRKPICEVCGLVFADATRFSHHKRTHHPKKEKCDTCGKCFLEKWQLADHMKAHQNERTYICNLCGKGFNRQKNLYIHKRCVHKIKNTRIQSTWIPNMPKPTNYDTDNDDDSDDNTQNNFSPTPIENQRPALQLPEMRDVNAQLTSIEVLNTIFS